MAIQDLTPQLRTRLSRLERTVGWFVLISTIIMAGGFGYYLYDTAHRKGWFLTKVRYQTGVANAAGLKSGDPVKLMGFDVGEIVKIEANKPGDYYHTTVYFLVNAPYYGYLWSDSMVKVAPADFLGKRYLEVVTGRDGQPTVHEEDQVTRGLWTRTNHVAVGMLNREFLLKAKREGKDVKKLFQEKRNVFYLPLQPTSVYWLDPQESPALTERLDQLARLFNQKGAIGDLLIPTNINHRLEETFLAVNLLLARFTNQPGAVGQMLIPTNTLSELNEGLATLNRSLGHFEQLTARLNSEKGAGGDLILPPHLNARLENTLTVVDTNLVFIVTNLNVSLYNLANLTSNLNQQVQTNDRILSQISSAVTNADTLLQGLKRHWLLRSAFKEKDPRPAPPPRPASSGKEGKR